MGEVYKAIDTRLGRTVAIKTLQRKHGDRFEREARAIAALNHPHICQLYDIGSDYLVMEFVDGAPLRGPLPLDEALRFAVQICDALDAAHRQNIVHRDLKPANILVTASGVKLLDFGLALSSGVRHGLAGNAQETAATIGVTQANTIVGTAAYMSPEQATGENVDARSDIFSFGAVFYEMLSGRQAFRGESIVETISSVLRDEPPPLDAPPAVATVLKRCLCKSASGRFATIRDVSDAIRHVGERSADAAPSIAVLPFANLSADPEQEYFSDGLADDIINALVKIRGLKVIARTSAFAFKGQHTDVRKIADTLGVANVLEGSVRRSGNRIRVTAQLVTAADGSHLWSERYDRQLADVFEVQDEIAAAIADALRLALAPPEDRSPHHTPNIPAYEALLTARHFHWQVRGESMARAGEFYERAIALDAHYAVAHALYADYLFGRTTVGMSPLREVAPLVRAAALRALELDPDLRDAHAPLVFVAATHDYDWDEAARRVALATSGGAISPLSRMGLGWAFCLSSGRLHEAVEQLDLAVQGDPLHLTHRAMLAMGLGAVDRFAEAEELLSSGVELDPGFFWTYSVLAELYAARDMMTEALPVAKQAFTLAPWYAPGVGIYAGALVRTGDREGGREVARSLGSPENYGVSIGWALFHTTCGELDAAAEWFARAIEERYSMVGAFLQSAIGQPLRRSAHWPSLARLRNLPT